MDAYVISDKIKKLWVEAYNKNSGLLDKTSKDVYVYVEGKRVVAVEINASGHIELKVEND